MLGWWGPIIWEYYGGTENAGMTVCSPNEWLAHKGTVGRAVFGRIRICADDGREVPAGQMGTVYFEQPTPPFEYHGDPEKTAASRHHQHPGWTTMGDIGFVDSDGYLYLTDRKAFMIISGGVNIYPQEIEHLLVTHEAVRDVAVIGVPNDDLGEEVKAVVELTGTTSDTPQLRDDLLAFCRQNLARYKVPRSIDVVDALPRLPTGKLYKQQLRARYRP
jgi:acyl-CoA synthetase (AMP-forming)/AMP-acid ligase II